MFVMAASEQGIEKQSVEQSALPAVTCQSSVSTGSF